jgi:hypothetical protein
VARSSGIGANCKRRPARPPLEDRCSLDSAEFIDLADELLSALMLVLTLMLVSQLDVTRAHGATTSARHSADLGLIGIEPTRPLEVPLPDSSLLRARRTTYASVPTGS